MDNNSFGQDRRAFGGVALGGLAALLAGTDNADASPSEERIDQMGNLVRSLHKNNKPFRDLISTAETAGVDALQPFTVLDPTCWQGFPQLKDVGKMHGLIAKSSTKEITVLLIAYRKDGSKCVGWLSRRD